MKVNTIICGDSLEVLKTIPKNKIDCIITSPPYNFDINYSDYNDNISWKNILKLYLKY